MHAQKQGVGLFRLPLFHQLFDLANSKEAQMFDEAGLINLHAALAVFIDVDKIIVLQLLLQQLQFTW